METPTQLAASPTVTATSSGPAAAGAPAAAAAAIETIADDTLVTATGGRCGPVGFMPVAYAPAYAYARPVVYAPAYRPVVYAPSPWAYAAAPAYGGWWGGYRRS